MEKILYFAGVLLALGMIFLISETKGEAMEAKDKNATQKEFTGGCHCGEVRYKVTGPIVKCSTCKCRGCQKASGTLAVNFVTVKRKDFTLTGGKPATFRAQSDAQCDKHGEWVFCSKCGTQIYWKGFKGDEFDLFAGTLDDTSLFQEEKK